MNGRRSPHTHLGWEEEQLLQEKKAVKACHLGSGSTLQEALGFHLKEQCLGDSICKSSRP